MPRQQHARRAGFPRMPLASPADGTPTQMCFVYDNEGIRAASPCDCEMFASPCIEFDSAGNRIDEDPSANGDRYKYAGKEFEATEDLQYNRPRSFDPTPGRWATHDALGFFPAEEQELYPYPPTE
jgi:RHS repeat-associated protein